MVELEQRACIRASVESGRGRVVAELFSGASVLLFLVQEPNIPAIRANLEALREASTRDDTA